MIHLIQPISGWWRSLGTNRSPRDDSQIALVNLLCWAAGEATT